MAQCAATKRSGERCEANARRGKRTCAAHPAAPIGREIELAAARAVRNVPIRPVRNPLQALSDLAGEIVAFKDWLRGEMEELDSLVAYDDKGAENIRAVLAAYERALDRSVVALATIARLKIDERLARISEEQSLMILRAMEHGLRSAGINGDQAKRVKTETARNLRVIKGAAGL